MSFAFIINPKAAAGKTLKTWNEVIEPLLKEKNVDFRPFFTERREHAIQIARDAATTGGFKNVISIGGDGTFHEVTNGLMDDKGHAIKSSVSAGIICSGTGSDFIKTVGIPRDPAGALEIVLQQKPKKLDILKGTFTGLDGNQASRYSINIADAGFGGDVVDFVNRSTKIFGGKFSFTRGALDTILKKKPIRAKIELDGIEPREVDLVAIFFGNCIFNGGGLRVAKDADPMDGVMDVALIEGMKKMAIVSILLKFYKDKETVESQFKKYDKTMHYGRHKKARVSPVGPGRDILLDFDGEMVGKAPLDIEIIPSAINVLLP
nr:diacylglycerol kinase family lipid kinase [Candidatus Sigynarchaeota archaeon]